MKTNARILQYFQYKHLPDRLQKVTKKFRDIAIYIDENLGVNDESSIALMKLLEAKECAVRSKLIN